MTTAYRQRQFDLRIETGMPLWPIKAAMAVLNRNEDDVLSLIEDGELFWAFDLRIDGAERAEWRIWRESIVAYTRGAKDPHLGLSAADVVRRILPPGNSPTIRRRALTHAFCCSHTHVTNLIDSGLIGAIAAPDGRERFRLASRAGAKNFLLTRCRHLPQKIAP